MRKEVALVLIVLLAISGGEAVYILTLRQTIDSLSSQIANVQSDYQSLLMDYSSLEQENTNLTLHVESLSSQLSSLNAEYTSLQREHSFLQSDYFTLSLNYTRLDRDHEVLKGQYVELQTTLQTWEQLHIGTTLETYYDYVRANVMTIGGYPLGEEEWWMYPDYYEDSVWLAACMAAHDVGNLYWPSLETEYLDTTGEYSCYSAQDMLERLLDMCEINLNDDHVNKIDKILGFVNSIITYETRLVDHMWFPTETLTFRSGDCTSYSILVAALLEMVDIKSAIGFFLNDQGDGHAMVLINSETLGEYKCWYFQDLTDHGLSSGRWIIIEPQYSSLSEQETYQDEWIPQWDLEVAAEVKYGP